MLRALVLLLLLANAGYFAWSQGLLAAWGFAPAPTGEPHRLQQQIRPEALRILRDGEAKVGQPAAVAGAECLLAGPLEEGQLATLKAALAPWPAGSWSLEPAPAAGGWLVYMGPYASAEEFGRKQEQLRQLGVAFQAASDPQLEPGLELGRFASEAAAGRRLEALAAKGVRSARLVPAPAETSARYLKLAAVDARLRPRLDELRPALHALKLRPCRATERTVP